MTAAEENLQCHKFKMDLTKELLWRNITCGVLTLQKEKKTTFEGQVEKNEVLGSGTCVSVVVSAEKSEDVKNKTRNFHIVLAA